MGRGIVAKKTAAIPRLGLNDILLSMSYKFNRGRVPPREVKRFRAVPQAASSSQQAAYFCRIQCPVVGVCLVGPDGRLC